MATPTQLKAKDIFTPGRYPTWTLVREHLEEKSKTLHDALDDGSMLVSVSGPSKSGKTVFIENAIGSENLIQITGAGIKSADDAWLRVFDIIGTPVSKTVENTKAFSGTVGAKASAGASVILAKTAGEASVTGGYSSTTSNTGDISINFLQLLIKELANTDYVIFIDDFHYIHRSIQSDLARQIKEAIRNGVKFICASVPYHSDDVIRSNPDLRGRIVSIDFDYWGDEVLEKIAIKGFAKANVSCRRPMLDSFVSEAAGSPQLMQYLCLNACYEIGVRVIGDESVDLVHDQSLLEKICQRTVLSTDYSSVVKKMIEGPKTRGSDRKIHMSNVGWQGDVYLFLLTALSLDPPQLNFRYQPLVNRISSLCLNESPSGSSITSACAHSVSIANGMAHDSILEWDGENDVFDIRDPYFLFYIRWSEALTR
ncbi:hypothetical protein [Pelagicoccus sp. SDUM812005]|uniref:hypothetical protein n=1 Tax=Pelagicoccus sp. SDUM812005 TaxID=3041257 RepID=UPI00280D8F62|nr:hypothetical protein [Pelagicoccus sp. SDUM812005]MDQ8183749.1 hypothetical protein [Pelagicoccus sp. SDUM812005]